MASDLRSRNQAPSTMKEVAERAGVALSSVSRVLNNHPDVSAEMRLRVLKAVQELGYEPDLLASSLRRGSTNTVGFIVRDISNPIFIDMLKGAEHRLRERGLLVLLAHSIGDPDRDLENARLLRRRRTDGLILSMSDERREDVAREIMRLGIPVVLLDRSTEALPSASAVVSDHRTGVRRATEHLLELGHKRISLITSKLSMLPARERLQGLREGFARKQVEPSEDLARFGEFSAEFGHRMTEELLKLDDPPTAIIAGGPLLCIGVIAALHREEMQIAQDISVIACDDHPLAEFHTPPITVVARDTVAMGQVAAALLLELLEDDNRPRVEVLPTQLILRESTAALR